MSEQAKTLNITLGNDGYCYTGEPRNVIFKEILRNIVSQEDVQNAQNVPLGLGGGEAPASPYPQVSLPQHDTITSQKRKAALVIAKRENYYDYVRLPGAVVHGNVMCDDVQKAAVWRFRGGLEEQEDNFGVDDGDPEFAGVPLIEAVFAYVDKNINALLTLDLQNLGKIEDIKNLVLGELFDNDLVFNFEIIDPIILALPQRKCYNVKELDFYPTFCTDHPLYEQRIKQWPKASYDADYNDDDLIGWLMTASQTPVFNYFKPYTEHLTKFPITNNHFKKVKGFENDDLDAAMREGRLFIVDYKDFHKLTVAERNGDNFGARLYAGIALFGIPANGEGLKTIAIQPTQNHIGRGFWEDLYWFSSSLFGYGGNQYPPSKIVTPADNAYAWKMAKSSFTTMTSMASVVDHLSTHVYLGPIPVAYFRTIPEYHPLRPLLDTHLMALVTNNHTGIFQEIGVETVPGSNPVYGSPFNGLLTGGVERLSGFSSESFVQATLNRAQSYDFFAGSTPFDRFDDPNYANLEEYPQHDDNKLMPIIQEWVDGYLRLYYYSDDDVIRDNELQAFLAETRHKGLVKGFPDKASSIEELVDIVSRIIYWMSPNHGFSSFSSFMKLGALGFYRGHPIEPSYGYSERDWLNTCPPVNVGMALFVFSRLFTDLPEDWHRSLGKYPKGQFKHDPNVYPLLENFQTQLRELDDEIRVKNERRRWAYDLRMPSTLTCSPWN